MRISSVSSFYSLSALGCMMAWFATIITNVFLFESMGVRNFGFVIRILRFMFIPFYVGLDQVCLGCHLFRIGCLLFFAVCIFYDDVSDQISQGQLLLFIFLVAVCNHSTS